MKKLNLIIIVVVIAIFFAGYLFFRLDDAYIFYTYARNIADGNGYVFNPGEKVNATTSPLYTLLLALFYLIVKPIFPDSLVYIGSLISTASVCLILYIMKKIITDENKFILFVLIFFSMPVLKYGFGMETFLNLALILTSIYFLTQNKILLASVIAGLAVLARLDSILFAGILFLFYLVKSKRFPPLSVLLAFIITILPWFVFSKIYFNSLLPTTIELKLTQHNLGIFGDGFIFLTGSIIHIPGRTFTIGFIVFAFIISLIYFKIMKVRWILNDSVMILSIWSAALFLLYAFVINAPPYKWYYIPFTLSLSLIFATFSNEILSKKYLRIAAICFLFFTALALPIKNIIDGHSPKYNNFIKVTSWLNSNVKEGSSIAADDIGILSYNYKKGKMVDALGLVNPEVSEHLTNKNFNWLLDHYKPTYVVHEYPELQVYLRGDREHFEKNYRAIKVFETKGEKIAIYERMNPEINKE